MKKTKGILAGVLLIAVGVIFALNTLEITNIDIFFENDERILQRKYLENNKICIIFVNL